MHVSHDEATLIELLAQTADETLEADLSGTTADTTLESLGMDSLDQLELVTALEDKLGIRVPDTRMNEIKTVGELVSCLLELERTRLEPLPPEPAPGPAPGPEPVPAEGQPAGE